MTPPGFSQSRGGDEGVRGPRERRQRADLNARRYRQPPLAGAQAKGGLSATRLPGTTTNPMNLDKGAAEPSLPASASRPLYSRPEAEAGSTSISVITGPSNSVIVLTMVCASARRDRAWSLSTAAHQPPLIGRQLRLRLPQNRTAHLPVSNFRRRSACRRARRARHDGLL